MDHTEAIERISLTNQRINGVINDLKFVTESRITYTNTQLVKYIDLLYQRALYNYTRGIFHASPGLWAIIAGIVILVSNIILFIRFIISALHIVEIIQLADILRIIWPKFRAKYDEIMGKISEASAALGFGADGLIHLIQSTQSGIALLGGVLGKDDEWSEIQIAAKAIDVTTRIASFAHVLERDPAHALVAIFREQDWRTKREIKTWWDKTVSWLTDTTSKAETALKKVNDTIDNLFELHNNLPQIVRDNIPPGLFDGLTWVDNQIDDTILPALTQISKEFTTINDELQAQRDRAQELANKLLNPGDLLLGVDELTGEAKKLQEIKIDDVTSRLYESETDQIYSEDAEVIEGLDAIKKLAALTLPVPEFINLETVGKPGIILDPYEKVVGWFVGDY